MSSKVDPVTTLPVEPARTHTVAHAKGDPKVHKAAQEFEAMFVRQIPHGRQGRRDS